MAGKARLPRTSVDTIVKDSIERKKQFGRERSLFAGIPQILAINGIGSSDIGGGVVSQSTGLGLPTSGGTMMGPIAFFPKEDSIDSSGKLDISLATGTGFSSRVEVESYSGTSDNLVHISGAAHAGQILFLQAESSDTITLKHLTTEGLNLGNIYMPSGSDYVVDPKEIVLLQWDTKNIPYLTAYGQWTLVATSQGGGTDGTLSGTNVWTGTNTFKDSTGTAVKFWGDNADTTQTVAEFGSYSPHEVKFVAEIHGNTGRTMSNPEFGGADISIPGSDPALMVKSAVIMNTYTMYDLDTMVFSVSGSSTTPPPEDDWVWIEANTGTSGSPVLTGMHYNVPSSKTHQFKVDGTEEVTIDSDGIELATGNFITWNSATSGGWKTGTNSDTLSPDLWLKVKYGGSIMYVPAYYP